MKTVYSRLHTHTSEPFFNYLPKNIGENFTNKRFSEIIAYLNVQF